MSFGGFSVPPLHFAVEILGKIKDYDANITV